MDTETEFDDRNWQELNQGPYRSSSIEVKKPTFMERLDAMIPRRKQLIYAAGIVGSATLFYMLPTITTTLLIGVLSVALGIGVLWVATVGMHRLGLWVAEKREWRSMYNEAPITWMVGVGCFLMPVIAYGIGHLIITLIRSMF